MQHQDIEVEITKNGRRFETINLGESNLWIERLSDLDATDQTGATYNYQVRELTALANYTTNIAVHYEANDHLLAFTITNTFVPPITAPSVKLPDTGIGESENESSLSLITAVNLVLVGFYIFKKSRA